MPEPNVNHSTFVVERAYPQSPARVFASFAQAGRKRRWYAEGEHEIQEYDLDFRVGGAEHFRYRFDLAAIAEVWRHGSVVSSWLLDLTAKALASDPALQKFTGRVADSGEGRWTLTAAIDEGVPAPVLSAALFERFSSRGQADFADQLLSAMRFEFGGHAEQHGDK